MAYRFIATAYLDDARASGVRFGDRKVFLSTIPGIDLTDPDCTFLLDELRRMQLLTFARADFVAAMDPVLVSASEWRLTSPTGGTMATFHFLVIP